MCAAKKSIHEKQRFELIKSVSGFSDADGLMILEEFQASSKLLLVWVEALRRYFLTKVADELLHAVASSIREAAAFAALGLVRPSLFALRAQLDLMLSWLYFKDHPVEYKSLCRTGDGFVLKKEALRYFTENYTGFGEKFGLLSALNSDKFDVYRLLSAHVHSQSPFVISEVVSLKDVVREARLLRQCVTLQGDVAQYLSDILFSLGIISNLGLPAAVTENLTSRLTTDKQKNIIFQ
ncbi:hypothetical protein [Pseudomonas viridiflava]|uniref:hypothetical protein n=1 Tax=Pseudomonas viridiflava TaxID=33069 RepID=UPI000EFB93BD|nr:hypothetical protein [Pseudomonas viridiflava]